MAHKALNIYSLALHRRNLPTPAVDHRQQSKVSKLGVM